MKTSKVEAKNKIAIRGDINEPFIVALTDLMIQNREFYDELKKVIDVELWDGYDLDIREEEDNKVIGE